MARLSGPLPGSQHASAPELRPGTGSSQGSRKPSIVSHLDFNSAGCETAFPVSQDTVLYVGLTSGRDDVTPTPLPNAEAGLPGAARGPKCCAETGNLVAGLGERAGFTLGAVRGKQWVRRARQGRAGWSGGGRRSQPCGGLERRWLRWRPKSAHLSRQAPESLWLTQQWAITVLERKEERCL